MKFTEAKAALRRKQRLMSNSFCPLVKGNCNLLCVSFFPGEIREAQSAHDESTQDKDAVKYYIVFDPCCNNPLITGQFSVYKS